MSAGLPFDDAAEAFAGLASVLYRADSYLEIYEQLCRTAVELVPGCDHACITMVSAGQAPQLQATTDQIAARVDRLEWQVGEGPCIDAIMSDRFECDPAITVDPTWPRLAERVLRETPVRGMVGYRILVGERKVGALNLFADQPGALTPDAADAGAVLAAFASVAITAATQKAEARSLRDGLASNREIGKAVGLLMATHSIGDDAAFAVLREASTTLNRRLADIARQIVEEHNTAAGSSV